MEIPNALLNCERVIAQVKIKTMSNLITVITYLYSFVSFTLTIVFSLVVTMLDSRFGY